MAPVAKHESNRKVLTVIAPGAGMKTSEKVFDQLKRPDSGFEVRVEGHSKASYDVYPPTWQNGRAGSNLQTFGEEVVRKGFANRSDCLLFGSRGGQVVLPVLWRAFGNDVPPAVVINGGCAMSIMPTEDWQYWPVGTVTFLLMGGEDFFRGGHSPDQHILDAMSCVPLANGTTAILYVNQMKHMPQREILQPVLQLMLHAAMEWKISGTAPGDKFGEILTAIRRGGFSGRLVHKCSLGDSWEEVSFSASCQNSSQRQVHPRAPLPAALKKPAAQEQAPQAPAASGAATSRTAMAGTGAGRPHMNRASTADLSRVPAGAATAGPSMQPVPYKKALSGQLPISRATTTLGAAFRQAAATTAAQVGAQQGVASPAAAVAAPRREKVGSTSQGGSTPQGFVYKPSARSPGGSAQAITQRATVQYGSTEVLAGKSSAPAGVVGGSAPVGSTMYMLVAAGRSRPVQHSVSTATSSFGKSRYPMLLNGGSAMTMAATKTAPLAFQAPFSARAPTITGGAKPALFRHNTVSFRAN